MSITRNGWTAYARAAAVIVLDQLSKYWILAVLRLPEYATHDVFWPLQFTRIWNQGVSFGMLQASQDLVRWGLVAFSSPSRPAGRLGAQPGRLLPAGPGPGDRRRSKQRHRPGAVQAVVDFIDVRWALPWIFSIADSGITVGVSCYAGQPAEGTPGRDRRFARPAA